MNDALTATAPIPFRAAGGLAGGIRTNSASSALRQALESNVKQWQKTREALAVEIGERVERLQDIDMTIAGAVDMIAKIDREAMMRAPVRSDADERSNT